MKIRHTLIASAAALLASTGAHAASQLGEAPDPSVIVTVGIYEWVWAGPCAPVDPSCGVSVPHHGFDIATDAQWLASFADASAVYAAFVDAMGNQKCASTYFNSVYDHCDSGDLAIGAIWHSPLPGSDFINDPNAEAFYVRAVPEPETYALMLLGLAGLSGFVRRQRR